MTFKEFGSIVEESPGTFKEYGTLVDEPSRARSLVGAPLKGASKRIADIMEFVAESPPGKLIRKIPSAKEVFTGKKEAPPKPWEDIREFAEEKFPTQEKELEKYLERAGGLGAEALLSPGGLVAKGAKTLGGAALGYATEKLGAPDWAQAIAESLPFFYSGGKKIPLKPSQKNLGEFLRKQGLTENEIAPLLKSPEQIELWSKFAAKGGPSKKLVKSIYEKSGKIYDTLETAGKKAPPLSEKATEDFLISLSEITDKMPVKYRNLIRGDIREFMQKGRGGFEDLTNLYKDINAVIGAETGGKAIIGQIKEPIVKAMKSISPELAEDFQLANQLYGKRAKLANKLLTRSQVDNLIDLGELFQLVAGVFNGDVNLIGGAIGVAAGRKLARQMLINPRLQNISTRVGEALKNNKYALAEKGMREFAKEVGKKDKELEEKINLLAK